MVTAYYSPAKLEEALGLIAKGAVPVAGATGLYSAKRRPEGELVDVAALGLGAVGVKDGVLELGAAGRRNRHERGERMQAKIRDAQLQKIPYMLIVGDKDQAAGTVSVRQLAGLAGRAHEPQALRAVFLDAPVLEYCLSGGGILHRGANAAEGFELLTLLGGQLLAFRLTRRNSQFGATAKRAKTRTRRFSSHTAGTMVNPSRA